MFIAAQNSFTKAEEVILNAYSPLRSVLSGLISGTQVETENGWRSVETLKTRDRVYTYDGELRDITNVDHSFALASAFPMGLVHIPGGVLSNSADLMVLPDQKLLIESEIAVEKFGSPSVLVNAADLCNQAGIRLTQPTGTTQIIRPEFDDEEIIWANSGMLFQCSAVAGNEFYQTLDSAQTHALLRDVLANDDVDCFGIAA